MGEEEVKKKAIFNFIKMIGTTTIIFILPLIVILAGVAFYRGVGIIIDCWHKDTAVIATVGIILFLICIWIQSINLRVKWLERRKV